MANRKISARPSASPPLYSDVLPLARPGDASPDRKATIGDIVSTLGYTSLLQYRYGSNPVGDGTSRKLSSLGFATLVDAQVVYKHATSLNNEHDWCVIQAAINAAVDAGGGTVFIPKGTYMMTNTADAAEKLTSGTLYLPKSATLDRVFSIGLGTSVSLLGSDRNQTFLYWPADLGHERYAVLCKDKYNTSTGVLGNGDRQIDWFGATYEGYIRDLTLVGPAWKADGTILTSRSVSNVNSRFEPPAIMQGLGWGARRSVARVRITGFYAGINIIGDQTRFEDVRCDYNYYGIYFDNENYRLYGNFVFDKVMLNNNKAAAWACSHATAIAGSEFNQCFAGEAPYGFLKEHDLLIRPWRATTNWATNWYCVNDGGKVYKASGADTGGNTGSSGPTGTTPTNPDGAITWTYVSTPSAYLTGQTYAQGTIVTNNGSYYLQIQPSPNSTTGSAAPSPNNVPSPGPVGKGATIADGYSSLPHVWRWLGYMEWRANTAYSVGTIIQNWSPQANLSSVNSAYAPGYYKCTNAGTSGTGSGPVHGKSKDYSQTDSTIADDVPLDGNIIWAYCGNYNNTFLAQNVQNVTQFEKCALGMVWDDSITVGLDYDNWSWIAHEHHNNCQYAWGSYSQLYTTIRTRVAVYGVGTINDLRISNATNSGAMTPGNGDGTINLTLCGSTVTNKGCNFLVHFAVQGGLVLDGDISTILTTVSSITNITAGIQMFSPSFKLSGSPHFVSFRQTGKQSGYFSTMHTSSASYTGDVLEHASRTGTGYNVQVARATAPTTMRVAGIAAAPAAAATAVPMHTSGASVKVRLNQKVCLGGYYIKKDTDAAAYTQAGAATYSTGLTDPHTFGWLEYVFALAGGGGAPYVCTAISGAGTTGAAITGGPYGSSGGTLTDNLVTWAAVNVNWAGSAAVNANTSVRLNKGNVYQCITNGTTNATGGPGSAGNSTDFSSDITDGTAHWAYRTTLTSWNGGTVYSAGLYVVCPDGNVYRCKTGGTSATALGALPPSGTPGDNIDIIDNGATWNCIQANTWLTPWTPGVNKVVGNMVWNSGYGYARLINL